MTAKHTQRDSKKCWITVIGGFIVHFLTAGFEKCNSIWFIEIQSRFGTSAAIASTINSTAGSFRLLFGPLSVAISAKFGMRWTVFLGGLLASLGIFLSAFAPNIYLLFFTYGIIFGAGLMLVFTPSLLIGTTYFQERRATALSLSLSGAGFAALVLPPLVTFLVAEYSYGGAMLISSAVIMHYLISASLFFPMTTNIEEPQRTKPTKAEQSSDRKSASVFGLLRDPVFAVYVCSYIFNMMGSGPVTTLIMAYAGTLNMPPNQSAFLLSMEGITQVIFRLASGAIFDMESIKRYRGFVWAADLFVCSVVVCMLGLVTGPKTFFLAMAVRGAVLAIYISQQTVITIDMVDGDTVASNRAIGLTQLFKGFGVLIGSAVSGSIKDWTESFPLAFLFLGLMQMLGCFLAVLGIYVRTRQRKQRLINMGKEILAVYKGGVSTLNFAFENNEFESESHQSLPEISIDADSTPKIDPTPANNEDSVA